MSENLISFFLKNKRYPESRPIVCKVDASERLSMYDLKKKLLKKFAKEIIPTITDFRFVTPGGPEETNDTYKPNYFDVEYHNQDAYTLMKIYNKKTLYFRTKQLSIYVKVITKESLKEISFPLSFEGNSYEKLITNIFNEFPNLKSEQHIIHVFQDTKTLDEISHDADMKIYQEKHLIAYLYPIEVQFINKIIFPLKFNKTLIEYLPDINEQININNDSLSFRINGNNINGNIPVHDILNQQMKEPVFIDIFYKKGNLLPIKAKEEHKLTNGFDDKKEKQLALMKQFFEYGKNDQIDDCFSFLIGENDEKYHKIIEKIGEGASAVTYKIIDTRTNEIMCKKILKVINNPTFKDQKQAMNEFQILYSTHHPCICRGFGMNPSETIPGYADDINMTTISLFLEYIDYNLKDCLKDKMLNDTIKARIIVEVSHGLFYLHKIGMIHRDIKVENVMLNSVFEAKLIDFGLVKSSEELEDSITKGIGTLPYMSPEMANMEDYNYKTDVYSFGILLHAIFVGSLPKQNLKDKLNHVRIPLPSPSSSISQCCIDLISKCTDPKPDKRPDFDEIIEFMKKNSFKLTPNVNSLVVSRRNFELEITDQVQIG